MHISCVQACTYHACKQVRIMHASMYVSCMHTSMYACNRECMQSCMHVWACTRMPNSMLCMPCIMHVHEKRFQKNRRRKPPFSFACEKHARACMDMNVQNVWTLMSKRNSWCKRKKCMIKQLRKIYYACGSMLACPTMTCHGARMRHAMRDMYAYATINLTC